MTDVKPLTAPLKEHEDMARWASLPLWAQQELEQWRRDEAHQRGLADALRAQLEVAERKLTLDHASTVSSMNTECEERLAVIEADRDALRAALEKLPCYSYQDSCFAYKGIKICDRCQAVADHVAVALASNG